MTYTFDTFLATKYGVNEAILLNNFIFWIAKNEANRKHFHDGRYWTYNSVRAYSESFPFWSEKQIRTTIASLERQGVLLKGNYNEQKYDRSLWYAFTDDFVKSILQNGQIDFPKRANGLDEMGEPIPNNKADNKPNISTNVDNKRTPAFDFKKALLEMGVSEQHASDWMAVRKAKRMTNTRTAFDRLKAHIERACKQYTVTPDDCVAFAASKDWGGFDSSWEAIKEITKNNTLNEDDRVRRAYAAAEAKFKGDLHF